MKNLFLFLTRYSRSLVIIAIIASVVSGLCNTAFIAVINEAIAAEGSVPQKLTVYFVGICVLLPASRIASQLLLTQLSQKAIMDLRMFLARRILSAPLRKLEEHGANKLLAALTDDVLRLSQTLTNVPSFWMNVAIVFSCIAYLFYLNPIAAASVIVAMVIGVAIFRILGTRAFYYQAAAREEQDSLYKHFKSLTEGSKELKLHRNRKKAFLEELLGFTASSYRRNNIIANAYFAVGGTAGQVVLFVVIGLLVLVLPTYEPSLASRELTGFTLVLLFMIGPLDNMINVIPTISNAVVSLRKVEALGVSLEKFSVEEEEGPMPEANWQRIELDGITHAYHREKEDQVFTLGPITFDIKPGELIFLIGGNGSGKTTLAKMLLGLYIPDNGQIRFNGEVIDDNNRDMFRQNFTAVFSDFFLFESMLGLDAANLDEEVRDYLMKLQLEHKVKVKDGALSTTDLSQGQRKRLALLTAYLEDRPIYLFDEWAADQDPLFKEVFYLTLLPNLKARGKTIIAISHDDHYYHIADRLIKLDNGGLEYDKSVKAGRRK